VVLSVAVRALQEFTFPKKLQRLVAPEPGGGVEICGHDAVEHALDDPSEGSDPVGEHSV
jgi:hypothetical protein